MEYKVEIINIDKLERFERNIIVDRSFRCVDELFDYISEFLNLSEDDIIISVLFKDADFLIKPTLMFKYSFLDDDEEFFSELFESTDDSHMGIISPEKIATYNFSNLLGSEELTEEFFIADFNELNTNSIDPKLTKVQAKLVGKLEKKGFIRSEIIEIIEDHREQGYNNNWITNFLKTSSGHGKKP